MRARDTFAARENSSPLPVAAALARLSRLSAAEDQCRQLDRVFTEALALATVGLIAAYVQLSGTPRAHGRAIGDALVGGRLGRLASLALLLELSRELAASAAASRIAEGLRALGSTEMENALGRFAALAERELAGLADPARARQSLQRLEAELPDVLDRLTTSFPLRLALASDGNLVILEGLTALEQAASRADGAVHFVSADGALDVAAAPLILWEPCEYCTRMKGQRSYDLLVFERLADDEAMYRGTARPGIGDDHEVRRPADPLRALAERLAPLGGTPTAWPEFALRARQRSADEIRRIGVDPEVFVERPDLDEALAALAAGADPVFALIGATGRGKSTYLAHLASERMAGPDIVLLYGPQSLPAQSDGRIDVIAAIGADLGLSVGRAEALQALERTRPAGGLLWLLVDALNEHDAAKQLVEGIYRALNEVRVTAMAPWIRIVIACRRGRWDALKTHVLWTNARTFELGLYDDRVLPQAYAALQRKYKFTTPFRTLTEAQRQLFADPGLLAFAARAFAGRSIPRGAGLVVVLEQFLSTAVEKAGGTDARELIHSIVGAMWARGRSWLTVSDPSLAGQVGSVPYRGLVDASVLVEEDVAQGGFFSRTRQVRFARERIFEFLLGQLLIDELAKAGKRLTDADAVASLLERGETADFLAIGSALASALVADAVARSYAEDCALAVLLTRGDYRLHAMAVEALVGLAEAAGRDALGLLRALVRSASLTSALAALATAYALRASDLGYEVFDAAYANDVPTIRNTAVAYAYWACASDWQRGEQYLRKVAQEAGRSLPRTLISKRLTHAQQAFLGLSIHLSPHLLTDRAVGNRFAAMWDAFYAPFGPTADIVSKLLARKLTADAIDGWRSGGVVVNIDTLKVYFDRPVDDPMRRAATALLPKADPHRYRVADLADEAFALAQVPDGALNLLLVAVIAPHVEPEPEASLALLGRMFTDGNSFSRFNALRILTSVVLGIEDEQASYAAFLERAVLKVWRGREEHVKVGEEMYPLGHLMWPLLLESLTPGNGPLAFAERYLEQPWEASEADHVLHLVNALTEAALRGFPLRSRLRIDAMVDIVLPWLSKEPGGSTEERQRVREAVAAALARLWLLDPAIVETRLPRGREYLPHIHRAMRSDQSGRMLNAAGQLGLVAPLMRDATRPGFVATALAIYRDETDVARGIGKLIEFMIRPSTVRGLASLPAASYAVAG